ncbi:hypothetical protein ACDQ55_09390 [Chitinophaga sp. 30R24]|uniref:hypothetical protein n=1 Tax=Chitinophaga sp. 30R24 TaxID=3248838 RepID=UPI003B8F8CDE
MQPEKRLLIETDNPNFTPFEKIPLEFRNLIIPAAAVFYNHDDEYDMICQNIRIKEFSIWMHEVFAMENIILAPQSEREILALHFMASGETTAEILDRGPYKMAGKEMNLFKLGTEKHKAPMKRGDTMFSFHINMLPATLPKLAEIHPELQQLAAKEITTSIGPINTKPYQINLACYRLINEICQCRYLEMHADVFLYRCCIDLFINFAHQDNATGKANATKEYAQEMHDILKEALDYIEESIGEEFSMAKMAYLLDVNAQQLRDAFENIYFITPEAYAFQRKMIHGYHLTVGTKATPEEIALDLGFKVNDNFTQLFESYFNCSFIAIRNAQ